ncbi:MAG: hypothetical protein MJ252_25895, partial [archaeon]|nr:hypothetical protein [archaeon]
GLGPIPNPQSPIPNPQFNPRSFKIIFTFISIKIIIYIINHIINKSICLLIQKYLILNKIQKIMHILIKTISGEEIMKY